MSIITNSERYRQRSGDTPSSNLLLVLLGGTLCRFRLYRRLCLEPALPTKNVVPDLANIIGAAPFLILRPQQRESVFDCVF